MTVMRCVLSASCCLLDTQARDEECTFLYKRLQ